VPGDGVDDTKAGEVEHVSTLSMIVRSNWH
jgi:hypothetical protein